MIRLAWWLLLLSLGAAGSPAAARESLGMFGRWGAFRDAAVPRCYAIAMAEPSLMAREVQPYATVASWPRRGARNQFHLRLSRRVATNARVTLSINGRRFLLSASGADAWAADRQMDAAVIAAMRSAPGMSVRARDWRGRPFGNAYLLAGVATAMDAATIGCARA